MQHDVLDLDIESILDFSEKEESEILKRLDAGIDQVKSCIGSALDNILSQDKEYVEKYKTDMELIAQLHSTKKDRATKLDNIVLSQKVLDKKMAIAVKQQVELRDEIDTAKSRKESLLLEMVDLDQEIKDNKKLKKDRWNAIKKACSIYKENLNFHIEYTPSANADYHDRVKITFFINNNPNRDTFYVNLLSYENSWKVGQIEPALEENHVEELKSIVDITKPMNVPDVVACLYKIRNIFSKHYFK